MKIEEALTALRLGEKIRHPSMPDDEYYMACKVSLLHIPPDADLPLSIVWIKSGKEHPDMRPKWNPYDPKTDPCKHGMAPMINLLWLMSDDWEILK
jgi:hypothetical protein